MPYCHASSACDNSGMSVTHPETIKRAILHPEPAIRRAAVDYFASSHSRDASVMETVIAAVQRYGRGENWMVVVAAQPLRQNGPTLNWAVEELRQPFEADDIAAENYHHAVAGLIAQTPLDLVADRLPEASSLPEPWQAVLDERRRLAALDWDACWTELEHLGRQVMAAGDRAQLRGDTTWRLYDIEQDRTETTDLSDEHPEVVDRLRYDWEIWRKRWARPAGRADGRLGVRRGLMRGCPSPGCHARR